MCVERICCDNGPLFDENLTLRSRIIDFKRYVTPHTGAASADLLLSVIDDWDLKYKIQCITSDNGSDMCSGIRLLYENLSIHGTVSAALPYFHIRCVVHVISPAVKECVNIVRNEASQIRSLISSIKSSTKRRDKFDELKVELGLKIVLFRLSMSRRDGQPISTCSRMSKFKKWVSTKL